MKNHRASITTTLAFLGYCLMAHAQDVPIFAAIWRDHDPASRRLLSDQLNEVLAGPESELALIWREWSGYMFSNHADTRAFFELFKNAVEGPGHGA